MDAFFHQEHEDKFYEKSLNDIPLQQNSFQTAQLLLNTLLLFTGIISNCIALQGAVNSTFPWPGYQRFLISLLVSDLYICVANGILLYLSSQLSLDPENTGPSYCYVDISQRMAVTGVLANVLSFVILAFDHFTQVVLPFSFNNILRSDRPAKLVILVIWALSLVTGFVDYPIRAVINSLADTSISVSYIRHNFTSFPMVYPNYPENSNGFMFNGTHLYELVISYNKPVQQFRLLSKAQRRFQRPFRTTTPPSIQLLQAYMTTPEVLKQFTECDGSDTSPSNLYRISMEICVLFMAICLIIFLLVLSCIGSKEAIRLSIQRRLRRSMITAIMLLSCFIIGWTPIVCYELLLVVPVIIDDLLFTNLVEKVELLISAEADGIIHPICFGIFMFSPIAPPIIFIFRNLQINRYLAEHYGVCCSCCCRDPHHPVPHNSGRPTLTVAEAPLLCRTGSSPYRIENLALSTQASINTAVGPLGVYRRSYSHQLAAMQIPKKNGLRRPPASR